MVFSLLNIFRNMNRKLKIRSFSFLMTSAFIATMILINIFASMLTERFFIKADLTETGLFTISERASEFLGSIDTVVDVIVLAEESTWTATPMLNMVLNTLQSYSAAAGGRLHIQYVNPDLNYFDGPKYGNSLTNLRDAYANLDNMVRNDIIFLTSYRASLVSASDLFVQAMGQGGRPFVSAVRTDQVLIRALLHVLNEDIPHAVFVRNHNESPGEYLKFVLDRSGYSFSDIHLAIDEIPDYATVVFTVAPKIDFFSEEIEKLERYLISGGNVVVLYDFATLSLPVFDAFLAEWGISVENKLIFDEDHTYPQYGIIGTHIVSGYLESTVRGEFETTQTSIRIGAVLARPLRSLWVGDSMSGFTQFPMIVTFSSSSYAKSLDEGVAITMEREAGDESGPFVIAYNVNRVVRDSDGDWTSASLVVAGADMFDDEFLGAFGSTFFNQDFIAGLASDFNPGGDSIFIPAKPLVGNHMPVTSGNARTVLIIMVILTPAAIYAAAIVVWYKRRHK